MTIAEAPPSSSPAGAPRRQPRFPGSPPFRDSPLDRRLFFGRDAEAESLFHSIVSHDLFVLYARSGTGKTSLLAAAVADRLRGRNLWPVFVRLNDPAARPVDLVSESMIESARSDPEVELLGVDTTGGQGATDLWDLLAAAEFWRGDVLLQPVFIFDQFEELFTLWQPEQQRQFIADFSGVARRQPPRRDDGSTPLPGPPHAKFVLSLREDFLGELDAFEPSLPQILRHRYRMRPLSWEQAGEAIRQPALVEDPALLSEPFEFSDEAVDHVRSFLSEERRREQTVATDAVEAFQLQIICHHIETEILPTKLRPVDSSPAERPIITLADLGDDESEHHLLERILSDFYTRQIEHLPPRSSKKRIQRLCESGLISGDRRLSLEQEQIGREYGVRVDELAQLEQQRLIRSDPRVGSVYYELAHDSLVAPILATRDERRRQGRRRLLIAGAVFAAVAAITAVFLGYWFGSGDESDMLETGVPYSGEVVTVGEVQAVPFEGKVGEVVVIVLDRSEFGRGVLEILAPAGVEHEFPPPIITPDGSLRTLLTLPADGVYQAQVQALSDEVGTYHVTLMRPDVTKIGGESTRSVAFGEPVGGIDANTDLVAFEYNASAGRALTFSMSSPGTIDVLGPDGRPVSPVASFAGEDSTNTTIVSREDATLRVIISAAAGEHVFEWSEPGQQSVGVGGLPETDRLTAPGEVDIISFEGQAGLSVLVSVSPSAELDPVLSIIDASGSTLMTTGDQGLSAAISLPADGLYRVLVRDRGVGTGSYELAVIASRTIGIGEQVDDDRISTPGTRNVYAFDGRAGDVLVIEWSSDELDGDVYVDTPAGSRLDLIPAGVALGADDRISRAFGLTFAVKETGTHQITVEGDRQSVGGYRLVLDEQPAVELERGVVSFVDISMPSRYRLTTDEGLVALSVERDAFDSGTFENVSLSLRDEEGRQIDVLVAESSYQNERVLLLADLEAGSYTLDIDDQDLTITSGPARLMWTEVVELSRAKSDYSVSAHELKVFTVDATNEGDAVLLARDTSADVLLGDGVLELYDVDESGNRLVWSAGADDNGSGLVTDQIPLSGSPQLLIARGYNSSSGPFTLEIATLVAQSPGGDNEVPDESSQIWYEWFTFDGVAGEVITLDVTSSGAEANVSVVGADGTSVLNGTFDAQQESYTIWLPSSGTYYISLREWSDEPSDFEIAIARTRSEAINIEAITTGEMGQGGPRAYTFVGAAGQMLALAVFPTDGLDVSIELVGPDGRPSLALGSDSIWVSNGGEGRPEVVTARLPSDGVYTLIIRSDVGGGAFEIRSIPWTLIESGVSSFDAGVFAPNGSDRFVLTGEPGDVLTISVESDASESSIFVSRMIDACSWPEVAPEASFGSSIVVAATDAACMIEVGAPSVAELTSYRLIVDRTRAAVVGSVGSASSP